MQTLLATVYVSETTLHISRIDYDAYAFLGLNLT